MISKLIGNKNRHQRVNSKGNKNSKHVNSRSFNTTKKAETMFEMKAQTITTMNYWSKTLCTQKKYGMTGSHSSYITASRSE